MHIDNMVGGPQPSQVRRTFETLVLVKATDIAAGFLRLPSGPFYPSFSKTLHLEGRHMGVRSLAFLFLFRLVKLCKVLKETR